MEIGNMKKLLIAAIAVAATFVLGADKKNSEPFYRKYLNPAANSLDARILEQEKRVAANPDSADLHNDFGNLLAARRFPKEAREQYETAMKLDKHHFLAAYNLGLLYETQGEFGKAITAYEHSVDRNRGFPPSRFRLGRLYELKGSNEKAIEQYARAFQIDPEMRLVKYNPLVVDSKLLHLASLKNYENDLATATMAHDSAYVDMGLVKKLPVDRTLSSEDLKPPAPAPDNAPPTPVQVIAPSGPPSQRPPVRPAPPVRHTAPAVPEPAPDVVVPAEPAFDPTPPPLPTPDAGGRPPYVGGPGSAGGPVRPMPTPTPGQ